MKISKMEKIWLFTVVLFFVLYNLPGVPAYGDSKGMLIHGVVTIIPLWIAVYIGMIVINKRGSGKKDEK